MSNDFNRSLLHDKRIKNGLSMNALAEKLDVSVSQISKWENGSTKPRQKSIDKLSHFFGVTTDYWESFYHEPKEEKITLQKPLNSFTPKPPVREEAREAFDKAINPHEADKGKVRENLEKINKPNSLAEAIKNVGKALVGDDIEHDAYKQAALQVISDLKNDIKAKDTEIQGLKCELEGLKVENANLKGQIEGLKFNRPLGEPIKPVVTYASGTGEKDMIKVIPNYIESTTEAKPSFWKRVFG